MPPSRISVVSCAIATRTRHLESHRRDLGDGPGGANRLRPHLPRLRLDGDRRNAPPGRKGGGRARRRRSSREGPPRLFRPRGRSTTGAVRTRDHAPLYIRHVLGRAGRADRWIGRPVPAQGLEVAGSIGAGLRAAGRSIPARLAERSRRGARRPVGSARGIRAAGAHRIKVFAWPISRSDAEPRRRGRCLRSAAGSQARADSAIGPAERPPGADC
jgi:hypothetical protein